jgi:phosphoenolpyruvate---glycerone phosphotransferase subunit DhaK
VIPLWLGAHVKKLINDPADVMRESLGGLGAAHPDILKVSFDPVYVVRADAPVTGKVGIISGGGSGHEPLHGGFVGKGMLDAACPGQVFTSPSPDQMEAATVAVDGGAGVLYIVKNYTGDVLNFDMAAELCQARGIQVEQLVINDDVAVQDSLYTAGRRGLGVTVVAEKICGAAAARGCDLARVAELGRKVNGSGHSMGMALTSCTVPAAGKPTFELGEGDIEMGVGIHGEPGRKRMPLRPAKELAAMLAEAVLAELPLHGGDRAIAMVTGMGGTPLLELYLMYRELDLILRGRQIEVARNLVGNYITSLDMAGCAITILKADDELLSLWDDPVLTPALRWGI